MRYLLDFLAVFLLISGSCAEEKIWPHGNNISWYNEAEQRLSAATVVTREMFIAFENKITRDGSFLTRLKLNYRMGNTMFALAFDGHKLWNKAESHFIDAIYNGVLCDNITIHTEDTIRNILYGLTEDTALTEEQRAYEQQLAKLPLFSIDCKSSTPDHCFCNENKVLLYCLALRIATRIEDTGFIRKKCDDEIAKPMTEPEQMELWQNFTKGMDDFNRMYSRSTLGNTESHHGRVPLTADTFEGAYNGIRLIHPYDPENRTVQFYCTALEPSEPGYMKELYAANPTRWVMERELYTVYGPLRMNVYTACLNNANFTSTEFGSCLCAFDRGFTFCFYKVIAKYIKQEGFLDCDTLSFNTTSYPNLELAFAMPASSSTHHFLLLAASILLMLLIN